MPILTGPNVVKILSLTRQAVDSNCSIYFIMEGMLRGQMTYLFRVWKTYLARLRRYRKHNKPLQYVLSPGQKQQHPPSFSGPDGAKRVDLGTRIDRIPNQ